MQQTGETRDAIIEDDNRMLQAILDANKGRKDPYWIVLFAKAAKGHYDGKPTLVKHMKAYPSKPGATMGAVIGKVDNQKGTVDWEVNMPQIPFDFDRLPGSKIAGGEFVVETNTIPHAYLTQ